MPITKTITLYEFSELSPLAKMGAICDVENEGYDSVDILKTSISIPDSIESIMSFLGMKIDSFYPIALPPFLQQDARVKFNLVADFTISESTFLKKGKVQRFDGFGGIIPQSEIDFGKALFSQLWPMVKGGKADIPFSVNLHHNGDDDFHANTEFQDLPIDCKYSREDLEKKAKAYIAHITKKVSENYIIQGVIHSKPSFESHMKQENILFYKNGISFTNFSD